MISTSVVRPLHRHFPRKAASLSLSNPRCRISNRVVLHLTQSRCFSSFTSDDNWSSALRSLKDKMHRADIPHFHIESVDMYVRHHVEKGKVDHVLEMMDSIDDILDNPEVDLNAIFSQERDEGDDEETLINSVSNLMGAADLDDEDEVNNELSDVNILSDSELDGYLLGKRSRRGDSYDATRSHSSVVEKRAPLLPQAVSFAVELLEDMKKKNERDPVLYGLAVVAYAEAGLTAEAFLLINEAAAEGALLDQDALRTVATACETRIVRLGQAKKLERALQLQAREIEEGVAGQQGGREKQGLYLSDTDGLLELVKNAENVFEAKATGDDEEERTEAGDDKKEDEKEGGHDDGDEEEEGGELQQEKEMLADINKLLSDEKKK